MCTLYTKVNFQQSNDVISQNNQACSRRTEKWKQDTGNKYCCHCIVNVHSIHQSDWWCHFPEYPCMQNTQRVAVMWLPQDTGNKYCCYWKVNVHIAHHSEFSNRVLMPFPRISNHAVYSWRVLYHDYHKQVEGIFCSGQMLMSFPRISQRTSW